MPHGRARGGRTSPGHLESWQGAPVGHRREPRARMAYVSSRSPLCRVAGGREPAAAPQGVESATRSEYAISQGRGAFGARALNHLCRAVPRLDLEPQRQPLLSPCSAAGLAGGAGQPPAPAGLSWHLREQGNASQARDTSLRRLCTPRLFVPCTLPAIRGSWSRGCGTSCSRTAAPGSALQAGASS